MHGDYPYLRGGGPAMLSHAGVWRMASCRVLGRLRMIGVNLGWRGGGRGRRRGKSAVVPGAERVIARASAELFAREGARLVVNDVDGAALDGLRGRLAASGA